VPTMNFLFQLAGTPATQGARPAPRNEGLWRWKSKTRSVRWKTGTVIVALCAAKAASTWSTKHSAGSKPVKV